MAETNYRQQRIDEMRAKNKERQRQRRINQERNKTTRMAESLARRAHRAATPQEQLDAEYNKGYDALIQRSAAGAAWRQITLPSGTVPPGRNSRAAPTIPCTRSGSIARATS